MGGLETGKAGMERRHQRDAEQWQALIDHPGWAATPVHESVAVAAQCAADGPGGAAGGGGGVWCV